MDDARGAHPPHVTIDSEAVRVQHQSAPARGRGFRWLLVGTGLFLISNGGWIIPAAAWLAPIFLLRFTRSGRPWAGGLIVWLAMVAAGALHWRGLIPLPGLMYVAVLALIEIPSALSFLVDRLVT